MSRVLPILFNTEMVRAILDGRKTVTRRVMKPQPKSKLCYTFAGSHKKDIGRWGYPSNTAHEFWGKEFKLPEDITEEELKKKWNPPYHTDDILYVRETWAPMYADETSNEVCAYLYKADRQKNGEEYQKEYDMQYPDGKNYTWEGTWRPSIHMPKEASRIWLKVKNVRLERLQEITEEQAKAEGAIDNRGFIHSPDNEYDDIHTAKEYFEQIWNSTIKKTDIDCYGWDANPWVWVIEFERCEKPEDF